MLSLVGGAMEDVGGILWIVDGCIMHGTASEVVLEPMHGHGPDVECRDHSSRAIINFAKMIRYRSCSRK